MWTCLRPAGDPRPTREKHTGRSERGNLNNRTVLGRHRGVRGEGIKSQKCASVPAYQQFSKIYTCVRARVFMETAGTLVRWYTRPLAGRQAAIAEKLANSIVSI